MNFIESQRYKIYLEGFQASYENQMNACKLIKQNNEEICLERIQAEIEINQDTYDYYQKLWMGFFLKVAMSGLIYLCLYFWMIRVPNKLQSFFL